MKMNKKKVISTIGALGLTAGVLAGCGGQQAQEDEYVKVVNSEGETMYVEEEEYEASENNGGGGMFILFSSWNGSNHSGLKASSGYKGKTFTSKPATSSGAKSGSGVGKSSGAKSGGFGG